MMFEIVAKATPEIPVKLACKTLGISRSGYYKNRNRPSLTSKETQEILATEQVRKKFEDCKQRVGSPMVTHLLRKDGVIFNEKKVARLMKRAGLKALAARKFKKTTDSDHPHPPAPNLLKDLALPSETNRIWITDITYLWTTEGWLYLCVFIDLATRKVVGWSVSKRITAELVIDAYLDGVRREQPARGLIIHSDRGSQYASRAFRRMLKRTGAIQSMSAKGRCYDNAFAESFFHTLKVEWLWSTTLFSRDQARSELFEYLEIYYNRQRLHSGLGYLTPLEAEELLRRKAA